MMPIAHATTGVWVGLAALSEEQVPIIVRAEHGDSAALLIDLPDESTYRTPVAGRRGSGDAVRFDLTIHGALATFDGHRREDSVHGRVQLGARQGSFWLRPVVSVVQAEAARLVGEYRFASGEIVFIGLKGDGAAKFPFYARDEQLVRLYPLSPDEYFSELGEMLAPRRAANGAISSLAWQDRRGHAAESPRHDAYRTEEIRFASGDVTLAGTLLLPHDRGPHAAVVLMHGALPSERDFYRLYAAHFTRHGLAALIYDKRGTGASTATPTSTIADRAEDGLAGLRLLAEHPDIDPRRIGLWGFSNATWSLPFAAARSAEVAFLIATGAAGVPMAEAETHRRVWELRGWGIAEATLAGVQRAWTIIFACLADGRWHGELTAEWEALVALLEGDGRLATVPLAGYARANPQLSPVPPLVPAATLAAMLADATSGADMAYDPIPDYERVRCPVLFLAGEADGSVPAALSAARVAAALKRGGNPDYTVMVVPGAGHSLNLPVPDLIGISSEEAGMELHGFRFTPGYFQTMTDWLIARV